MPKPTAPTTPNPTPCAPLLDLPAELKQLITLYILDPPYSCRLSTLRLMAAVDPAFHADTVATSNARIAAANNALLALNREVHAYWAAFGRRFHARLHRLPRPVEPAPPRPVHLIYQDRATAECVRDTLREWVVGIEAAVMHSP